MAMTWLQQSLHKPRLERLVVALASAMPQHGVASHYDRYKNPSRDWLVEQYQAKQSGAALATGKGVVYSYAGTAMIPAFRMPDVMPLGIFAAGVRVAALISSQHPKPILFGGTGRIAQVADQDVVLFNDIGTSYTWWRRSSIDRNEQNRGDTPRRFMAGLSQSTLCLAINDSGAELLAIDDAKTNVLATSGAVSYYAVQTRHDMAGLATIKGAIK